MIWPQKGFSLDLHPFIERVMTFNDAAFTHHGDMYYTEPWTEHGLKTTLAEIWEHIGEYSGSRYRALHRPLKMVWKALMGANKRAFCQGLVFPHPRDNTCFTGVKPRWQVDIDQISVRSGGMSWGLARSEFLCGLGRGWRGRGVWRRSAEGRTCWRNSPTP